MVNGNSQILISFVSWAGDRASPESGSFQGGNGRDRHRRALGSHACDATMRQGRNSALKLERSRAEAGLRPPCAGRAPRVESNDPCHLLRLPIAIAYCDCLLKLRLDFDHLLDVLNLIPRHLRRTRPHTRARLVRNLAACLITSSATGCSSSHAT